MIQNTELIIVGAGPAGIEAALTANEYGVDVTLVDSFPQLGGQYYKAIPSSFQDKRKKSVNQHEGALLIQMVRSSKIRTITGCLVWGIFKAPEGEGWILQIVSPDGPSELHAKFVIVATGAYDQPMPFPGWTLPGVITAGAGQIMVKTQKVRPGKKILLAGSGPLQLAFADQLIKAGVVPVCMLESSHLSIWRLLKYGPIFLGQVNRIFEGVGYAVDILKAGMQVRVGWSIVETRGDGQVEEAVIARLDENWKMIPGSEEIIEVDTVALGYGLIPNNRLSRMIDCQQKYDPSKGGLVPVRDQMGQTTQKNVFVIGDAAGVGGSELARAEGKIAAMAVASMGGHLKQKDAQWQYARFRQALVRQQRYAYALGDLFTPGNGLFSLVREDTILCRCEGVTYRDVLDAVRLGATSVNEVKMITRGGMGNCQGRMCENIIKRALLNSIPQQALTNEFGADAFSVRPPLEPLTLDILTRASHVE